MPLLKRFLSELDKPSRVGSVVFLALTAVLLLGIVGYFQMDLTAPTNITGDHLFFLTMAKSYINGHGFRFDSQLGYPGVRDSLYFPSFDLSYRLLLWVGARMTHNPFILVHGLYIVCFSAMALTYHWTLRRLGASAWLAVVGALASIVTPFVQGRSFGHDALALSFSVPMGFGLALLIGQNAKAGSVKTFFRDPFVWASVLVVGVSGLYYAFFTVMICLVVGAATGLGERRAFPILAAGVSSVAIFVLLLFSGYGFDLPIVLSGRLSQPHRMAYEQLLYGLDFSSAAVQFRFLPHVGERYQTAFDAVKYAFPSVQGGEWPGVTLTSIILSSPFVAIIGQTALPDLREPSASKLRLLVLTAMCLLFLLIFSVQGGLGFIFNLIVTPEIRATERVMPFLTFGAVVMFCTAAELARDADRRWVRYLGPVFVAVLLIAAMPKYLHSAIKWQSSYLAQPMVQELQKSIQAMLRVKDQAGFRTVLELPTLDWPETPAPVDDYNAYQHQLPYIYDRPGSRTRWSYGSNDRQIAFTRLDMQTKHAESLVERMRKVGFDSILVEKKAYAPNELAKVQAALGAQLAPACRLYEDDFMALYAMNRAPGGKAC